MPIHEKMNYVEYPSKNLEATKAFFQTAFGWSFADYGPEYAAFSEETQAKITAAGGQIV